MEDSDRRRLCSWHLLSERSLLVFLSLAHCFLVAGGGCALGTSSLNGRCWSGSVWLYSEASHAPDIETSLAFYQLQAGVPCGAWVSQDVLLVGTDAGEICWLDAASEDNKMTCIVGVTDHPGAVSALAVTCDSTSSVTADVCASLCVYDNSTQQRTHLYRPAHSNAITGVSAHPETRDAFVTASLDGSVLLWDLRQQKPAFGLYRDVHCPVTAVAWVSGQQQPCAHSGSQPAGVLGELVMGAVDGSVMLYCSRSRSVLGLSQQLLQRQVRRVLPCPEQPKQVAVCGDQETFKIIDISNDAIVQCYSSTVHTDVVRDILWLNAETLFSCGWDQNVFKHELKASS